jgi:hypothetical protein
MMLDLHWRQSRLSDAGKMNKLGGAAYRVQPLDAGAQKNPAGWGAAAEPLVGAVWTG